jgi:hypothetical protein
MMYSAASSHSSSVAASPALEQHGQRRAPGAAQQRKVLHVACAELNHVAVAFHQIDAALVHRFGHDLQAVGIAHVRQNFQAFLAETLKSVRRSARLERAAAKETRAAAPHSFGNGESLRATLNGARPRDERQFVAADGRIADAHDGLFRFEIERDQLVGLGDANCFGHARKASRSVWPRPRRCFP